MGIIVDICKIIEKDRDIIMRVEPLCQEINLYFKRFLPCLCLAVPGATYDFS